MSARGLLEARHDLHSRKPVGLSYVIDPADEPGLRRVLLEEIRSARGSCEKERGEKWDDRPDDRHRI